MYFGSCSTLKDSEAVAEFRRAGNGPCPWVPGASTLSGASIWSYVVLHARKSLRHSGRTRQPEDESERPTARARRPGYLDRVSLGGSIVVGSPMGAGSVAGVFDWLRGSIKALVVGGTMALLALSTGGSAAGSGLPAAAHGTTTRGAFDGQAKACPSAVNASRVIGQQVVSVPFAGSPPRVPTLQCFYVPPRFAAQHPPPVGVIAGNPSNAGTTLASYWAQIKRLGCKSTGMPPVRVTRDG